MILRFKNGASQHGFASPAEAWTAGFSYAVLDATGRPTSVGLAFNADGYRGVSFLSTADLWNLKGAEIDCLFVEGSHRQAEKEDSPRDADRLVSMLRNVRDEVIGIRRSVVRGGPADHAAMMAISAIDGLSSFLSALQPRTMRTDAT